MKKYEHFIFEYGILYDKIKKSDDIGKGDDYNMWRGGNRI